MKFSRNEENIISYLEFIEMSEEININNNVCTFELYNYLIWKCNI